MATNTGSTPKHPCISLQEDLAKYFGDKNYPAMANVPTGTTDALRSKQNTSGFTQIPTESSEGKARPTGDSNRKVQLRYVATDCDEDGMDEVAECNLGESSSPLYKTADITVTRRHSWGFDLSETDFRDICESQEKGYADFFMAKYAHSGKAGLNKKLIAPLSGLMGNYPLSGDNSFASPIDIPVVDTNGTFNPTGLALIQSIYQQMERSDSPILVGAGKMDFATYAKLYSATNDKGIDATKLALNYFRDAQVNVSLNDGDDHLFTWAPGAIQMVEWFDNVGSFDKTEWMDVNGKKVVKKATTTIMTPDGIMWDMYYEYDCREHKYRFQKWFDVAAIPSDAFGACQDYNYALHFNLVCGTIDCDDINAAVVKAAG